MLKKIALGTAAALTALTAVPAAADAHPRGRATCNAASSPSIFRIIIGVLTTNFRVRRGARRSYLIRALCPGFIAAW